MTAVASRRRVALTPPLAALVWGVAALSIAGFAAAWILAVRNRDALHITADSGPDRFLVVYPAVGAVLASRRRSNPIGWLLLGMGLVSACRGLAGEYALHTLAGTARPEAGVWAGWFVGWALTLLFPGGFLLFLLLLFPDGRPVTPRWWAVGWLAAGLSAVYLVVDWLVPGSITLGPGLPSVPNPTGLRALSNVPRRRVQAVVDRRFDRARYDAERVVADFAVQLREQVDLDVLGADLLGVVRQVLAPEHLVLWLNDTVGAAPGRHDPEAGAR